MKFPWLAKHRKAYLQHKAEEALLAKIRAKRDSKLRKKRPEERHPVCPEELKLRNALVKQQTIAERHKHNVEKLEDILHQLHCTPNEEDRKPIQEVAEKMLESLTKASK